MHDTNKERFQYVLGGGVVVAVAVLVGMLFFFPLPIDNKDILNIAIGSLMTMAGNVVGYFFGSSKSSADKNQMLADKKAGE